MISEKQFKLANQCNFRILYSAMVFFTGLILFFCSTFLLGIITGILFMPLGIILIIYSIYSRELNFIKLKA